MKKGIKFCVAILMLFTLYFGEVKVFAANSQIFLSKVGDTVVFDGEEYVIYCIDEYGEHLAKDGIMPASACINGRDHAYRVIGNISEIEKIDNDSSNCYVTNYFVMNRCDRCNDLVKSFRYSENKGHKYEIFGKKCKNIVNGTRCNYEK